MPSRYVTPVLLVIGALVLGLFFLGGSDEASSPDTSAVTATNDAKAPAAPPPPDPKEAIARARKARTALIDQAAVTRTKLEKDFPAEHKKWEAEVVPLLENDRGRAIAANETYTAAFFKDFDAPKASPADIASLTRQLAELVLPLETADPDSPAPPSKELQDDLAGIAEQADAAVSAYRTRREAIERLLAAAERNNPNPSGPTIAEATEARRRQQEEAQLRAAEAKLQAEREQAATQAARDAEAERIRKEKEAEAERARLDAESARQLELLRLANDPAFQQAFSPFLTKAETRVGRNGPYPGRGQYPAAFDDIESAGGFSSSRSLGKLIEYPDGGRGKRKGLRGGSQPAVERFDDFRAVAELWVKQCKLLKTADDAGKPCTPSP